MENRQEYNGQIYASVADLKIPEYYSKKQLRGMLETIRKSIQRFGVTSPLIVNANPQRSDVIIHGVTVFNLALEFGIEELPVMYVDVELDEEKQLAVLLDQKGTLDLSNNEIIDLIGQLDFESFFPTSLSSDTLSKHFEKAENQIKAKSHKKKRAINQLLIRLSDEDNAALKSAKREMGVKTLAEVLHVFLEIYNVYKNGI